MASPLVASLATVLDFDFGAFAGVGIVGSLEEDASLAVVRPVAKYLGAVIACDRARWHAAGRRASLSDMMIQ